MKASIVEWRDGRAALRQRQVCTPNPLARNKSLIDPFWCESEKLLAHTGR